MLKQTRFADQIQKFEIKIAKLETKIEKQIKQKVKLISKSGKVAKLKEETTKLKKTLLGIKTKAKNECKHKKKRSFRTPNSGTLVESCLDCGQSRRYYNSTVRYESSPGVWGNREIGNSFWGNWEYYSYPKY